MVDAGQSAATLPFMAAEVEGEWLGLLKAAPAYVLAALFSFWGLHYVFPRLAGGVLKGMTSSAKLRWQHQ